MFLTPGPAEDQLAGGARDLPGPFRSDGHAAMPNHQLQALLLRCQPAARYAALATEGSCPRWRGFPAQHRVYTPPLHRARSQSRAMRRDVARSVARSAWSEPAVAV